MQEAARSLGVQIFVLNAGTENEIDAAFTKLAEQRAGALMLDHLGRRDLHDRILSAIERVIAGGKTRTPDQIGRAHV